MFFFTQGKTPPFTIIQNQNKIWVASNYIMKILYTNLTNQIKYKDDENENKLPWTIPNTASAQHIVAIQNIYK